MLIYDNTSKNYDLGTDFDHPIQAATMIPSYGILGDNPGLLLLGGFCEECENYKMHLSGIFHFECEKNGQNPTDCIWKKLDFKLRVPRDRGIPIEIKP